jgi:hypothetical protein
MNRTSTCVAVLALAIVLVCAGGGTSDASLLYVPGLTDDFGNPNGGWTVFNAPGPALPSTSTGFSWTGYVTQFFFAFLNGGTTTTIDGRLSGGMTGSYAYTIFDSTGGNDPDTAVPQLGKVTIRWDAIGTTYPGAGTARIMLRDALGHWFLSDQAVPMTSYASTTLDVSMATWRSLDSTPTTLNIVTDNNTGPLTIGAPEVPDFSAVTGGGFFIASDTLTGPVVARVESMTFAVPEPSLPVLLCLGFTSLLGYGWRRRRR